MSTIYQLKPKFQGLLRPLARWLVGVGFTANQVTVVACLGSVALSCWLVFAAAPRWGFLLLPVYFFLRMAMNAIDGMMAREFGQATVLGALLNEITDAVSDAALYLPFAYLPSVSGLGIGLVIVLSNAVEMAGLTAAWVTGERRFDGPMGKSDRAFAFGAWGAWVGLGLPQASPFPDVWIFLLLLLLVVTLCNRIGRAIRQKD